MHAHQADPTLRNDPDFVSTLETWQPVIGRAILEAWGLPLRICDAVGNQDYLLGGESADLEPLTRLLSAAKLHHRLDAEPELRAEHPNVDDLLSSVNLGKGSFVDLVAMSQDEIAEMQQALAA
jgi:HD-like signal output (HDOD) protein